MFPDTEEGLLRLPGVVLGHRAGAGEQVAGAGVVAQPRPGGHDRSIPFARQVLDGRPAGGEGQEIGRGVGHGGLLQHDLRQPDPVRIGTDSAVVRPDPPRQGAGMGVVPGQQVLADVGAAGHT